MPRKGMIIDLARCAGCGSCVVACQMQNNTRPGIAWVNLDRCEWGEYPQAGRAYLPHACMQCDEPPCVAVCPTGASYTTDEGVTLVNYEDCINCGQCVIACPYGARHSNKGGDFFFDSSEPSPYEAEGVQREDVMEKCIFCNDLVAAGGQPACVANCPGKARVFGDIDDPESDISKKIAAGGKKVGATGFYYTATAGMPGDMIASKVMVGAAPAATPEDDEKKPTAAEPGISPVAIGAGVVVVAAGVGIGVAAKKNSDKKKAAQGVDKDGGQK
ncbi:MAG: 4Fe-4S dicluster domain-containing protein [Coriobacteriales bacterium]|nr:4Fe-4S dicluster domain-containing protein [Coriobacteriales bacterium]